jgi:hypothetical protein
MSTPRPEAFLSAKTLAHELRDQWGYEFRIKSCRQMIAAMALAGYEVVRGYNVKASDARKFILANPHWKPWSMKPRTLVKA